MVHLSLKVFNRSLNFQKRSQSLLTFRMMKRSRKPTKRNIKSTVKSMISTKRSIIKGKDHIHPHPHLLNQIKIENIVTNQRLKIGKNKKVKIYWRKVYHNMKIFKKTKAYSTSHIWLNLKGDTKKCKNREWEIGLIKNCNKVIETR